MEPEAEIIRAQLFALRDEAYRTFHSALMPTVPPETVIGVRVPALRRLAKQLAGTAQAEVFLQALPHGYYEENNLHAFLIELIRDYDRALAETEAFLPYINNWATCDCFCPKVFAKHKKELLVPIRRWLDSGEVYTVRYGMEMLMRYYLDDAFRPEYLEWAADVHSTEYYINMMMGSRRRAGVLRSFFRMEKPSSPGSITSRMTSSGSAVRMACQKGSEVSKLCTSYPLDCSAYCSSSRMAASSSTM